MFENSHLHLSSHWMQIELQCWLEDLDDLGGVSISHYGSGMGWISSILLLIVIHLGSYCIRSESERSVGSFARLFSFLPPKIVCLPRTATMGFASSPRSDLWGKDGLSLYSPLLVGKMSLHAFHSLLLNHPITWVGFALIFTMTIFKISITFPSRFMAHLSFGKGQELEWCVRGNDGSMSEKRGQGGRESLFEVEWRY